MFVPGYVESWICFIEVNEGSVIGYPFGLMGKLITVLSDHFFGNLEKLYILNSSVGVSLSWFLVECIL